MTLRSFGRATPIHMDMLKLVGYKFASRDMVLSTTEVDRKETMKQALENLKRRTGEDFGFDAVTWRNFLLSTEADYAFGYKHPYAFKIVDRAVQERLADPEIINSLNELKEINGKDA